ncbi:hypothetical protein [Providencia manganoxydans]|uniref:hypothetical protein n=1 Tax=Providencia manganoxydans TaxID=2923283 RepID=UPI0034DDC638
MDKSRQQFEEFIKFHMDDAEINNKFETANNGLNYADHHVDIMWIIWQASRESLDVELPDVSGIHHTNYDCGYRDGIEKCETILISNGVKIKNES